MLFGAEIPGIAHINLYGIWPKDDNDEKDVCRFQHLSNFRAQSLRWVIDVDQADDCLCDRISKNWVDDDDKNDDIKHVDEIMKAYIEGAAGLIIC